MPLERALSLARPATRGLATAAWTVGLFGAVQTHMRLSSAAERQATFDRYMVAWARGFMRLAGVRLVRVGRVEPPSGRARLVIANHRAAMDIPILLAHFAGSVVSRGDIATWPVLGQGAKDAQVIFVDQDSPKSRIQALRQIRARLESGRTVSVFPEGTTFDGDEVRPFFRGALAMGKGVDVEVVPVGLAYPEGAEYTEDAFLTHVEKFASIPRITVGMAIGEPTTLSDDKGAAEMYREVVQGLVNDARRAAQRAGG